MALVVLVGPAPWRAPCPDRPVIGGGRRQLRASPARRQRVSHVHRLLALPAVPSGSARDAAEGVAVPVNSAELLGLQGVQFPLKPTIEKAYEELKNTPLEDGYSELARLGKERILQAARQELHRVGGRTALLRPGVQIEQLLLPGAMALLHQVRRYDLVIQLSEEGAGLGARQIQDSSPHTLREIEQDMALATALAQCGLADRALKEGQPALACSRLEEALELLVGAPHAAGGGSLLGEGGPGAQQGQRALAPKLQAEIRAALAQYHPDAVADYLQVPLDRADYDLRQKELQALTAWAAEAPPPRRWLSRARRQRPALTADYMARIVPHLTAAELCSLYDWQRLAAGGSSSRCPWYFPGLLKRVALAHLVVGFTERSPAAIHTALRLFSAVKKGDDVALSLAVCRLLLGDPAGALRVLQDDEQAQAAAVAQRQQQQQAAGLAAAPGGNGVMDGASVAGRGAGPGPAARHAVMPFIRQHSPQGELDLRPGLAAFTNWWLEAVAYPEFQDTALGAARRPNLAAYFDDPGVQAFLASQNGKPGGGMLGILSRAPALLLGRFGGPALDAALHDSMRQQRAGSLLATVLRLLAGAAVLAAAVLAASRLRSSGWEGIPWALRPPTAAEQLPPDETTEAAAADIGLPAQALRRLWPQQWQQGEQQAAVPQQQQQQQVQVLSKSAAAKLVKEWLSVKAEAMGPRHTVARLAQVLDEPMLSAVLSEAADAAASGWYWNIRPHKSKVDSLDASSFSAADGGGHVSVLATLDESAELWGADGEQGESYKTTYQVEYTLVYSGGGWKIASALVLSS